MTATYVNKLVESFKIPTIPPIDDEPTYATIHTMHKILNSDAASVNKNLGCGTLEHLCLTLSPTVYATFSTTWVVPSPNSGATPVISAGTAGPEAAYIRYTHKSVQQLLERRPRPSSATSGSRQGQPCAGKTHATPRV